MYPSSRSSCFCVILFVLYLITVSDSLTCHYCNNEVINCTIVDDTVNQTSSVRVYTITCDIPSNLCSNNETGLRCRRVLRFNSAKSVLTYSAGASRGGEKIHKYCSNVITITNTAAGSHDSCFCEESFCNAPTSNMTVNMTTTTTTAASTEEKSTTSTSTSVLALVSASSTNTLTSTVSTHSILATTTVAVQTNTTTMATSTVPVNTVTNETSTGTDTGNSSSSNQAVLITISVLILAVILFFNFLLVTVCFLYRKHIAKQSQHSMLMRHVPPPLYDAEFVDDEFPITILNTIGYGKFGSVYRGIYEGSSVAVKVFSSHHINSWKNEKEIYTMESTKHKNVLCFIGSEEKGFGPRKQFYMITEYFSHGSLNRYLQHHQLNWSQALNMIHSVSSGLAHLHSNAYTNNEGSSVSKFAIAHRDVKSANVLVKDTNGHCVLGDLGLALILDPTADVRKMAKCGQVGTYRYMAPEALDARVNLRDIESFKQIDVYALSLVLWEVCSRCEIGDGLIPPYQSPYFNLVGERPTIDLMKHIVVVEKTRPDIMGCWESHNGLKQVVNIMEESWDEDSEARLTAANIVSRLSTLKHSQDRLGNGTPSNTHSNTLPNTSSSPFTTLPQTGSGNNNPHKKVRVSTSFSGHPALNTACNKPIAQRTRFSVGTNDSPYTPLFQRFHRRGSLTSQQYNEHTLTTNSNYVGQFSPLDSVTPLSESSDSANRNNDITNNTMNIDAATGQPNVASVTESTLSSAPLEYTTVDSSTSTDHD